MVTGGHCEGTSLQTSVRQLVPFRQGGQSPPTLRRGRTEICSASYWSLSSVLSASSQIAGGFSPIFDKTMDMTHQAAIISSEVGGARGTPLGTPTIIIRPRGISASSLFRPRRSVPQNGGVFLFQPMRWARWETDCEFVAETEWWTRCRPDRTRPAERSARGRLSIAAPSARDRTLSLTTVCHGQWFVTDNPLSLVVSRHGLWVHPSRTGGERFAWRALQRLANSLQVATRA